MTGPGRLVHGIQERRLELEKALAEIVPQLAHLGAVRIILFGSLASNRSHEYSDLDLLTIMPSTCTSKHWTELIYTTVRRRLASDILVYTELEVEERLPQSSFLQDVLEHGRVVYDAKQ
jgi:predicted nucleotidyltransferase